MLEPQALQSALEKHHYLLDPEASLTVAIALELGRPLLVEGPAGVGKTELAKALAGALPAPLTRQFLLYWGASPV